MLRLAPEVLVVSTLLAAVAIGDDTRPIAPSPPASGVFVENLGQADARAAFVCRTGATSIFATAGGFRVATIGSEGRGVGLCFSFEGEAVAPVGLAEVPGRYHFLRGADPSGWVTDARGFDGVAYRNVRPGVDVILRARNGGPSFDFVLAAGADVANLPSIEVDGVEALRVDAAGGVEADTALGIVSLTRPLSAAIGVDGSSRALASRFELAGARKLRVVVEGARDGERVLVDPELVFATLLGGVSTAGTEYAFDVTFDAAGAPIVVGWAQAADFPVTPGAFDTTMNGQRDACVTKFTADGSALVFSTLLGGNSYDSAQSIALGPDGTLFVTGDTQSPNFPVTAGALDTTHAGGGTPDGFLTRLTANGNALVWSTYFGGVSNEYPADIAVDASGNAFVVGLTNSSDYPVTPGAFDTVNGGFNDAFVTKFASSGATLTYSTLLGAPGSNDFARGIALGPNGDAYVTGGGSVGFPFTHEAFDPTHNGSLDAFVVRLNDAGTGLVAGTFLGGQSDDISNSLALGPDGSLTICGDPAYVFPTTPGSFDPTPPINFGDAFVARFDASLDTLVYSTYIGGDQEDEAEDVVVDAGGAAIVTGNFLNGTVTFPTTPDAIASTLGYSFLTRFDPTGSSLTYSTFLSGVAARPEGLAVQADGSIFVAGLTAPGFPVTPGAYDTTPGGGDVFVAKFDLCPGEVESHSTGCVGAGGFTPVLDVTGCASPGFLLEVGVSNALGHTSGLLLFGLGTASLPLNGSCALGIGPLAPALVIPITLSGNGPGAGSISFAAQIPAVATPVEFHLQGVISDPNVPGGVAATNAMRIRIDG